MQALIVTIRSHFFAFPLFAVLETVKVKKCDLSFIEGKEIVDVRGQPVQVANLGELWGMPFLPEKDRHIKKDDIHLIIASSLGGGIGFVVDEILREEEIYVKSLVGYLGKIKDVEGAAVLSGGEIAVVVDVFSLANTSKEVKLGVALEGGTDRIEGESLKEKKKILIVDDSYMIRELEKKILEDKNYRVETAIDGIDALNKITKVAPDLVITDAQMPNMDGFQMCETLKKNEKYKNIPVIMLTSLDKEEDKTKGTEAGADAYMTKEDFEQSKLLETVSRFAA
ncbi:hypothetical protein A3J90_08475 [candidate division WOR-1 bacterium RIFOXYC2_FULL_37_10]|nr:MAG: hypothetical protein A3J90_08475 [candidate division WOR-1 bacterium RIFOXYC2_FULL_37_10]